MHIGWVGVQQLRVLARLVLGLAIVGEVISICVCLCVCVCVHVVWGYGIGLA